MTWAVKRIVKPKSYAAAAPALLPPPISNYFILLYCIKARRAGADGSMSASGSLGPGFDLRRGSKFLFENFQPRG